MKRGYLLIPALILVLILSWIAGANAPVALSQALQEQHHQYQNVQDEWSKGNINHINSSCAEGGSVPYRCSTSW